MSYEHFERDFTRDELKTELEKADLEASKALIALIDSVDKQGVRVNEQKKFLKSFQDSEVMIILSRLGLGGNDMEKKVSEIENQISEEIKIKIIKDAIVVANNADKAYDAVSKPISDNQKKLKLILVNAKKEQKSEVNEFISLIERSATPLRALSQDVDRLNSGIRDEREKVERDKVETSWNPFTPVAHEKLKQGLAAKELVYAANKVKKYNDILEIEDIRVNNAKQLRSSQLPDATALAEKNYNKAVDSTDVTSTVSENDTQNEQVTPTVSIELAKDNLKNAETELDKAETELDKINSQSGSVNNDIKLQAIKNVEKAKITLEQSTDVLLDSRKKGNKKTMLILSGVVGCLLVALLIGYMLMKR
jgi:hypothetical protein